MRNVTSEQIETARKIDLLTYLRLYEPDELIQKNPNEYRTKSHGSLVISNGKFYYNRGQFGGVSALDYLVKVRGVHFVEAVEILCGYSNTPVIPQETARPPPRKDLLLPKPVKYPAKMVAYLQKRGITPEVIRDCMNSGILYESIYKCEPICVFVGRDETTKPRYAAMRGINSDLKQDVSGSDKHFGFLLPARDSNCAELAVFESAIDTLSFKVLEKPDFALLSLGGVTPNSLFGFLRNHQNIRQIYLCLDADATGQEAAKRIQRQLAADSRFSHIKTTVNPPKSGKDFNETLINKLTLEHEQKSKNKNCER